mgnify:FL=1
MSERDVETDLSLFVPPEHAQAILAQSADVTVLLNEVFRVERVFCAWDFDTPRIGQWTGELFSDCVAPDSQTKLQYLFWKNSATSDSDARWRHQNLCVDGKPDLPLLLKYFSLEDEHGVTRLLCARDLRPLLGIQKRFQREVDFLGNEKSKLEQKLRFLQ